MKCYEELHYKRSMHMLNKLLNLFPDGRYNKSVETEFSKREMKRIHTCDIGLFDYNNLIFLLSVALLGLNKESVEESEKHNEYKHDIDYNVLNLHRISKSGKVETYSIPDISKEIDINSVNINNLGSITFGQTPQSILQVLNNIKINKFDNKRNYTSPYDSWLSVENKNPLPNYDYNYLSNLRNALMHSEYNFEDGVNPFLLVSICNSNYTNFKAKLLMTNYATFIFHYFSNDIQYGIANKLYVYHFDDDSKANKEDELEDYIKNKITIKKINYKNRNNSFFEEVLQKSNFNVTNKKKKKFSITEEDLELTEEQRKQVELILKSYYGDDLYNMDEERFQRIVVSALKYVLDPVSIISSWIIHFFELIKSTEFHVELEDDFISGYAMEPTLLVLKGYALLYRLQNKELRKTPIDYDLVEDIDYKFNVDDYNNYVNRLIDNATYVDDHDSRKRFFTEIFRDSLAHGNIDVEFKEETGEIKQYLIFNDKYKNRERIIKITTDNLRKFLDSEAFSPKYLKKEEKDTEKSI